MNLSDVVIPPQLRLALKLAPWVLLAGVVVALLLTRATLAERKLADAARFDQLAAGIRLNTAKAELIDRQHKEAVETAQNKATQETEDALLPALDNARSIARDYAEQLRSAKASAAARGGTGAGMSGVPGRAGGAVGQGPVAELAPSADDLAICAENTVKAAGWQAWYEKQVNVPR